MFDCPFCRTTRPTKDADELAMVRARVEKKDHEAIYFHGTQYAHAGLGLQKDMRKAVELWTEAAELSSAGALYSLGVAIVLGVGLKRTMQRVLSSTKKRQCKDAFGVGTHLAC